MSNFDFENEAKIQRQKVNYFNTITKNNDFDFALNFLILADWDERKAVDIYFQQNRGQNPSNNDNNRNNPQQNNRNVPPQNNRNVPPQNNRNVPPQNNIPRQNNNQRNQPQQEPFQQKINNVEFHISDAFSKEDVTYQSNNSAQYRNFVSALNEEFNFIVKSLTDFGKLLKDHAGIIIILSLNKFDLFKNSSMKLADT